jgi:predicted DNA-binding transcriptional regulator YafY
MVDTAVVERLGTLRVAVDQRSKAWMAYRDAGDAETQRTVRPLGLAFFGNRWTLLGWCELREDFRAFRLDRVRELQVLPEHFADEPGKTMDDYLASMREEEHAYEQSNQKLRKPTN